MKKEKTMGFLEQAGYKILTPKEVDIYFEKHGKTLEEWQKDKKYLKTFNTLNLKKMNEEKKKSKEELERELIEVNKRLASIAFSVRASKQSLREKVLWHRKRKILAELNPINL